MNRILIVEDDEDLVNLSTHWLEKAGYVVEHAPDGAAALELLNNDPLPAVVLLDLMLPKIDGFEVLRRIRADRRTRRLPVVVVTSFSRDKDAARAREIGANDYIVKPLMELDFLKRIEHIVKDQ
jgi:DNA-binding response OmpR family regulator